MFQLLPTFGFQFLVYKCSHHSPKHLIIIEKEPQLRVEINLRTKKKSEVCNHE